MEEIDPYSLPPGLERRAILLARKHPLSRDDFTPTELLELSAGLDVQFGEGPPHR